MRLFSTLFGKRTEHRNSTDKIIDDLSQINQAKTMNGYSLSDIDPESIYPWANNLVYNNEITIGNIIILWWLDKYWDKNRRIPLYFERNYVKSFQNEKQRLINLGYLEQTGKLTGLGQIALSSNMQYVQKHREGWQTPEESRKLTQLHYAQMEKTAQMDESLDLHKEAAEARKQIDEDKKYEKIYIPFERAEKLSKSGQIEESLNILIPLLPKVGNKEREMKAYISERIAINFRKIKQYGEEIKVLQSYIDTEKGQYRYEEYKEIFMRRIAKAQQLMKKLNN